MKRALDDQALDHAVPLWFSTLRKVGYRIELVPEPDRGAVLDGLRRRGVELPRPDWAWPSMMGGRR